MGIVSATGRSELGIEEYEDFIQTDAPINPGNSGGALVNDLRRVDRHQYRHPRAGIRRQSGHRLRGSREPRPPGDGSDRRARACHSLVSWGEHSGSHARHCEGSLRPQRTGLGGALISAVSPDSPAEKAGLKVGDVILDINGAAVSERNQLRMQVSMMNPDQNVRLKVFRNGQNLDMTVRLSEMPGEKVAKADTGGENRDASLQGVSVEDLDARTARQLGLPASTKGVVVTEVDPASQAASAGLKEGDVIQQVNRQPVASASDFARAVKKSSGASLLLVNRAGNEMFLAV